MQRSILTPVLLPPGTTLTAAISIGIDPEIHLGPVMVTWHGLMTVLGIVAGTWLALVYGRERDLKTERIIDLAVIVAIAGMVGARLFYLLEQGEILEPTEWLGRNGFSIYGAVILAPLAAAVYMRRNGLGMRYLDAVAAGFPLGLLVGRFGDLVNGEHYGPPSDLPWAVRNTHPNADTPDPTVAYHSGGLYEMVLGLAILAVAWPLRDRLRRPGAMLWSIVALYSVGRFGMFFYRDDSDGLLLGLNNAQVTSLALLVVCAVGSWIMLRPRTHGARDTLSEPEPAE